MFPKSSFNNMLYPMSADIYYATNSQNAFGEIIKDWYKDKTISCSAIKQNPDSKVPKFLSPDKYIEYDLAVNFRTNVDILEASTGVYYKVTDVLVKDIKDASGSLVWKESLDEGTIFEIRSIEPMLDMFSNLNGFRIYLVRADNQVIS